MSFAKPEEVAELFQANLDVLCDRLLVDVIDDQNRAREVFRRAVKLAKQQTRRQVGDDATFNAGMRAVGRHGRPLEKWPNAPWTLADLEAGRPIPAPQRRSRRRRSA